MADQLLLIDLGEASPPKPKAKRRRKSRFSEKTIELAGELARRPLRRRSPLERMIDQACGYGGRK